MVSPRIFVALTFGGALAATVGFVSMKYALLTLAAVVAVAWLLTLTGWRRLYAVLLILMLCAVSSEPVLTNAAYYLRYVAAGLLALWTWRERNNQPNPTTRRLVLGLKLLAVIAVLSIGWSVSPGITAQQALALVFLTLLVTSLAKYRWADTTRIAADLSVAYTVSVWSFIVSIAAASIGLANSHSFDGRLQGIYGNPNTLGDMIALTIPLGFGLVISRRRRIYLLGMIPAVVALAQCQSRTALIATVIALAWLTLRRGSRAIVKSAVLVPLLTVAVLGVGKLLSIAPPAALTHLAQRFSQASGTAGGTLNGRGQAWTDALHLWSNNPLQGYGFQTGSTVFTNLYNNGVIDFSRSHAHDSYLQALLELGVLGAIPLLMVIVGGILPGVFRGDRNHPGSPFVGVVVAGLAVQITESAMFGTGQPYPWVFWLGVTASALAVKPKAKRVPASPVIVRPRAPKMPRVPTLPSTTS
jgi:exopolysaccharide production protein ExoQ